jgi:hypothetical protein
MKRVLLVLALIAAPLAGGQAAAHSVARNSGQYAISGVVVNAVTGQPLDRAEVSLHLPMVDTLVAETTTGEDGHFTFEHLAKGKYSLTASRRGYIGAAYDEHEGYSTAIVTGEGLTSDGLVFRLSPRAVIKGSVTDEAGDPVQQARVSLYRQNLRTGLGNIVRAGVSMTDDTGAYEFARLEAGNYYVAVNASPWYATRPQPKRDAQGNVVGDDQHSSLDVAYPTTFYADATDSDSATPIPVKAGDQVTVNFNLHAVPAVHLSVQVPSPEGRGFAMPQLSQDVFGMTEPAQPSMSYSWRGQERSSDGQTTVEFNGVAPGHYSVEMRGGGDSSHSASIDASSDAKIDLSQSTGMADVSGKVAVAGGEQMPDRLTVSLRSSEGRIVGGDRVGPDGTFSMHGVPPGNYEVWVTAANGSLAVTHLTATGAAAEGNVIKVGSAPVAVAATIADGSATVTGFAMRDGKPAAGVMILLVPRNPAVEREMFRRDQSDSDGSFQLTRVVPGEYTAVAIEDGWTLDWARAEVIAHYLAGGQKVTVPVHTKDFAIKDSVPVQPK